ncbi:MAG: fibronectin type III domain-containing protein [Firmicutes bacterium]|nr:fibronectin type III domain-containing protein [Bacillota bacterium]
MKNLFKKTITILMVSLMLMVGAAEVAFAATPAKVVMTAKQKTQTSVTISWDKVKNADGYEIYRKTGKDGTYKKIKTITSGKTVTYKNTGLTVGKKYYYKVRAYDGGTKGKYSTAKSVTLTYTKPKFTVTLPKSLNDDGTLTITFTNNSKAAKTYFDGVFALENLETGKVYNIPSIAYNKPESGKEGSLAKGKRLFLDPGEKVKFTCQLPEGFAYDKEQALLTSCIRYKSKDYVSVYSVEGKNTIYTEAGYYDYLIGAED